LLSKIKSALNFGMNSELVDVEVDISFGIPGITIVGLASKAVDEAKDRVKSAIKNSGLEFPNKKITINLAPADLVKEGPGFDLPISLGILAASGQVESNILKSSMVFGELSLDGNIRPVSGLISHAILAKEIGMEYLVVPKENFSEINLIPGLKVLVYENLSDLVLSLNGVKNLDVIETKGFNDLEYGRITKYDLDFSYIKGQENAKRCLEIAAAGGHNVLFSGPPGSGKTLLSRTFPSILPPLSVDEMIEVTKIYSISGMLDEKNPFVGKRPFRSPHHTISYAAMVGGGKIPKPGEISLAHRGVLFLDELPEFPRQVLEALRQPLEDKIVTISRSQGSVTFPANFSLISAMNPCPCGYSTDPKKNCTCSASSIIKYRKRISGPLLDRIDMFCEVPRVEYEKLKLLNDGEPSEKILERVLIAREIQEKRFAETRIKYNSEMTGKEIKKFIKLDEKSENLLKQAVSSLSLSARTYFKVIRMARTIADLDKSEDITLNHIAESLQYRQRVLES